MVLTEWIKKLLFNLRGPFFTEFYRIMTHFEILHVSSLFFDLKKLINFQDFLLK